MQAYYESDPMRRRRAVVIAVAMDIFIVIFVVLSIGMFIWAFG